MSATPSNTAFVLVPGSFSPPTFYHKIIPLLQAQGYSAVPISLPSVGKRPSPLGPATFADDVSAIKSTIQTLVDDGKDVILAMNSYGGFPGTEATLCLSKTSRVANGLRGGIIALVYLAAFIPKTGETLLENLGDNQTDTVKNAGEYMELNPEDVWPYMFNDLEEKEARHYTSLMPVHSTASFRGRVTHAGYLDISITYLLTEMDFLITPQRQMEMIEMAREQGGNVRVVKCKAGHAPFLSVPEEEGID